MLETKLKLYVIFDPSQATVQTLSLLKVSLNQILLKVSEQQRKRTTLMNFFPRSNHHFPTALQPSLPLNPKSSTSSAILTSPPKDITISPQKPYELF
jgi:hypothetical protein